VYFFEKYIKPRNISVGAAAEKLCIARQNLSKFINGNGGLSPEMAIKVGIATGTDPLDWLIMLAEYNLWKAAEIFDAKIDSGCLR
jgi:addiction module HigA family antidote